jgi:hypothetical protein
MSDSRVQEPGKGSRHSHRHRDSGRKSAAAPHVELPFSARPLAKSDYASFRPLLGEYLSIQKQIELYDLDEREAKGRWKSFLGKWNRGELAEGWYDPELFARVASRDPEPSFMPRSEQASRGGGSQETVYRDGREAGALADDSDDEDYGPVLPSTAESSRRSGPGIPSLQDLSVRDEMINEAREESREDLRAARKADRKLQKERLEELTPRAEPGTRERKLEKRQMINDKMREFRDKSPGMEAGNDKELMGGGDSLDEYKRMKEQEQRKKTAREVRREEMERAKREEMEERRAAWQQREEGTVSMLRELAKQRFG